MQQNDAVSELIGALVLVALITAAAGLILAIINSEPPPEKLPATDFELKVYPPDTPVSKYAIIQKRGDQLKVFNNKTDFINSSEFYIRVDGTKFDIADAGTSFQDIIDHNLNNTFILEKGQIFSDYADYFSPGDSLIAPYSDNPPELIQFIHKNPGGTERLLWSTGKAEIVSKYDQVKTDFYGVPRDVCIGEQVQFYDVSSNNPTWWRWTFGDEDTADKQTPSHSYTTSGSYSVSLRAGNSAIEGTETKSGYIRVKPLVADFTGTPVFGIEPLSVLFNAAPRCGSPTTYNWIFGDGTSGTGQNPKKDGLEYSAYMAIGGKITYYDVTLTASDGNNSHTEIKPKYITVCPQLMADFSADPMSGRAPLTVKFTDQTSGSPDRWQWNFGDGTGNSTSQNPSHTYTEPGTFAVTLTASNPCISKTITKAMYILVSPQGHRIIATAELGGNISPNGTVYVADAGDQTFSITADDCYLNTDLLVDNTTVGARPSYTFTGVDRDHTIHANFTRLSYKITPSMGQNGQIIPSTPQNINCGEDHSFTITADPCYTISNVNIDGTLIYPNNHTYIAKFVDIHKNVTISASFSRIIPIITVSHGGGGSINLTGQISVPCGNDKSFYISADFCNEIADIIIDSISTGYSTSPNITTFTNVTQNHTLEAVFTSPSYTITASQGQGGIITPPGTIIKDCDSSQQYNIEANDCYNISNVNIDGKSLGSQTSPFIYSFSHINASHTISATFTLHEPYVIHATAYILTSPDDINEVYTPTTGISPLGLIDVACGADQYFTIDESSNSYILADVIIDGESYGTMTSSYPYFSSVHQDHSISAIYIPRCNRAYGHVLLDTAPNYPVQNIGIKMTNDDGSNPKYAQTNNAGEFSFPIAINHARWIDLYCPDSPVWVTTTWQLCYTGSDGNPTKCVNRKSNEDRNLINNIHVNPGSKCAPIVTFYGYKRIIRPADFVLNAPGKKGYIQQGGEISFTTNGPISSNCYIIISGTRYDFESGDNIRIYVHNQQNTGNIIYMSSGKTIRTFAFDSVYVYKNGAHIATGKVDEINIPGMTDFISTLVLIMPEKQNLWTRFTWGGTTLINGENDYGLSIINLTPDSGGTLNVNLLNGIYAVGKGLTYTSP